MSLDKLLNLKKKSLESFWKGDDKIFFLLGEDGPSLNDLRLLEGVNAYLLSAKDPRGNDITALEGVAANEKLLVRSELVFRIPRVATEYVVAKDLNDFLSLGLTCRFVPRSYILWNEEAFYSKDIIAGAQQQPIRNYHDAVDMYRLLERFKDHQGASGSLIYMQLQKIEIDPIFESKDLKWPIYFQKISNFLGSEGELDRNKVEIFRSVLCSFTKEQPREKRFGYLIRRTEDFAQNLDECLAIYLAEKSPEKLSKEAQAGWLNLAEKLEKLISGMETKSLAIPVALLLAVKELKPGGGISAINGVILTSTLLFSITLVLSHLSQMQIIELIKRELEDCKEDFEKKGLSSNNRVLSEYFPALQKRIDNAVFGSWIMSLLGGLPLAICLVVAFFSLSQSQVGK